MHFVCKGGFLFYNNKKEEIKFSVLLSIGSFFEPKAPRQQLVNKKVLHFLNQSKENGAISLQINGVSLTLFRVSQWNIIFRHTDVLESGNI